jgi:hypothetical protein
VVDFSLDNPPAIAVTIMPSDLGPDPLPSEPGWIRISTAGIVLMACFTAPMDLRRVVKMITEFEYQTRSLMTLPDLL